MKEYGTYIEAVEAYQKGFVGPKWMSKIQADGLKEFKSLGLPSRQDEEWRYTNIRDLRETQISLSDENLSKELKNKILTFQKPFESSLVFVNGKFVKELSKFSDLLSDCHFGDLSSSFEEHQNELPPIFRSFLTKTAFSALNRAALGQGAFIKLKANRVLEKPIQILFAHSGTKTRGETSFSNSTNFVLLEKFSKLSLVETHIGLDDESYFNNSATKVLVGEGAHLAYTKIQVEGSKSYHVGETEIHVEKNATAKTFNLALGSKVGRTNLEVQLKGENATAFVDGLYALKESQTIDHHTVIDHQVPHAVSRQLFKGILDDESHAVFNGKIFVRKDAQKTDSEQLNKNLLLSKKAIVDTKPQLEISADDVKCAHGATVGQISEDQLFYFQSRCIPKDEARRLLIHGFADDVLERIDDPVVLNHLKSVLDQNYFFKKGA